MKARAELSLAKEGNASLIVAVEELHRLPKAAAYPSLVKSKEWWMEVYSALLAYLRHYGAVALLSGRQNPRDPSVVVDEILE